MKYIYGLNKSGLSIINHLFKTNEILGYRIATQHNLSFYNNLLIKAKDAIVNKNFYIWSKNFLKSYNE